MRNDPVFDIDFDDGNGPVPARRHRNPDFSEGGWVATSAFVEDTCYVGRDACIFGGAQLFSNVKVRGRARIFDEAQVSGDFLIFGPAVVTRQPVFIVLYYPVIIVDNGIGVRGRIFKTVEQWLSVTCPEAIGRHGPDLFRFRDSIAAIARLHQADCTR